MSKIADYLSERLTGEIATDIATRELFSTDGSIFKITPQLVIYPRTINDIRKIARFSWRLAERGQVVPLTARGHGSDPTGSAIGSGSILSLSDHMSQILEFDFKNQMLRVQSGLSFNALREAMATYGLFLPAKPSNPTSTIGGIIAQGISGARSAKYGSILDQVDRLEIVLANGEIIETGRISKRELSRKKGLQTMEGEIYRALDTLIDENAEEILASSESAVLDKSGFPIYLVKGSDGSFDLTPLFVGSQGTLGIISQVILQLSFRPNEVTLMAFALNSKQDLTDLTEKIMTLEPSKVEFIDVDALKLIEKISGDKRWKVLASEYSKTAILVEFDDKNQSRKVKKLTKILSSVEIENSEIATEYEDQEKLRSIFEGKSTIMRFSDSGTAALPITSGIAIEPSQTSDFVTAAKKILKRNHLDGAIWGNLSNGIVTVMPLINLANLGQRQAVFKFMKSIRTKTLEFNGSVSGEFSEGRLNAPFAAEQHSEKMLEIFMKTKEIFDPYNILNPGVKIGTKQDELLDIMRKEYNIKN